jgi:fused signal recognition particle receptor
MWGAFDQLRKGLKKTRHTLIGRLGDVLTGKVRLDAETLDEIEEMLINADIGVKSSMRITKDIEKRLKEAGGEATMESVLDVIRSDIQDILENAEPKLKIKSWSDAEDAASGKTGKGKKKKKKAKDEPVVEVVEESGLKVIFVVGVNGTGKTTSIAKLAHHYKQEGKTVLLAAGDTFRAAAVQQLSIWAERLEIDCIQQGQNADPAAVVFDALSAAAARGHDVLIIDTAGRLHTKTSLMDELGKVARVIHRKLGRDPETLLVVDANTGQNGLQQARVFAETIPVDGLVLTKLDGTARGGIVVSIAENMGLPVKWVGVGEGVEDFAPFEPADFARALFHDPDAESAESS